MDTRNNKWLELMVKGIKDNISLCGENEIIARLDGNPVTGSQLLALIESDDPIVYKFYEDIVGLAIRTTQLKNSKNIRKIKGIIKIFNYNSCRGWILLEEKRPSSPNTLVSFHSTSFQSSLPTRFPVINEVVDVTFQDDRLISVRSSKYL